MNEGHKALIELTRLLDLTGRFKGDLNHIQETALFWAEDQKFEEQYELDTVRNKILVLASGNGKLYDLLFDEKKKMESTITEFTPRSQAELEDLVQMLESQHSGQEDFST